MAGEPDDLGKIATGAWVTAAANALLAISCLLSARTPVLVPVIYDILLGIGFLYYWPTLLALGSRAAPAVDQGNPDGAAVFLSH